MKAFADIRRYQTYANITTVYNSTRREKLFIERESHLCGPDWTQEIVKINNNDATVSFSTLSSFFLLGRDQPPSPSS
jgi:hypothetical protein